jgi:hypothetical protein
LYQLRLLSRREAADALVQGGRYRAIKAAFYRNQLADSQVSFLL